MSAADHPQVHVTTAAEWRRWLRDHHTKEQGVWLITWRPATGKPRMTYAESIPEALAYGWIDSLNRPLDDERTMLLFTPRRRGSGWSRTNKERIVVLERTGRMRAAGRAKIDAAKRDGSWTLLDSVEALVVPPDLKKALGAAGLDRFDALSRSKKREHLYALVSAKRPETRAKRIGETVRSLKS